ncbi:LysR family transcriptional regulator [Paenibacillus nanensis]|uniref:LysR family transcriptional regulator n=1 Tax=Paenibacillus nanensis TaxID=393251 RepID=A0A3A1VM34_9BACL|nr:LysR family transcriptional regulator [Paenibacillus nanensis]RIX59573.1 LysR family transcriptional regulator [Paenibacillus nanensis]
MLEKLEGRFLVTFLTVLEEGSFSRAAEKLGYVQSTVTSQIQLLEQTCGQKLFHRLSRGVQITDAGERLAIYARQFVQLGRALEEALGSLEEPCGIVKICALESFCVTRFSRFLKPFLSEFPSISLHLSTGFQGDIVEQVLSHAIDFGIVPKDPEREEIVFEPLVAEPMAFVSTADLAAQLNDKGWEPFPELQMIGFGNRCVYHTDGQKLLDELGVPSGARTAEFPSTELIRQMIACGVGAAYLPEITMQKELAEGTVVRIPLPNPSTLTHGLIRHRDRVLNAPAKVFCNKLLNYFHITQAVNNE